MALGLWVFLGWMIFVVLTGAVFLLWAWRSGQFKNVEEAKYRMLEDREPEPWPKRPKRGGEQP
jgi:cbb3-type cytochrome oxidase maturation protein